jgi:hypothetical protein
MKCASILPLAIVLATTSAIGQDTRANSDKTYLTLSHFRADHADCPVGLYVNHGTFYLERKVVFGPSYGDVPPEVRYQLIHLTMTNFLSQDIAGAQITVHGYSDKWRVIPLSNESPAPDLAKTVDVALNVKGNGHASSELSFSRLTAVTAIDVNSVTYADGSTWHTPSPGACSVAPDGFMLVSDTR